MAETVTQAFVAKRGRPSAKQVLAINASIFRAAKDQFFDQGFSAASMEAIATTAGVSKGTLYARFPTKEALFAALFKEFVASWSARSAVDGQGSEGDIDRWLRVQIHTAAQTLGDPETRAITQLLMANGERFPELSRAAYDIGYASGMRIVGEGIRVAGRGDGTPAVDPHGVAVRLFGALTAWHQNESTVREVPLAEIEAFGDRTVDLFMAARTAW